MPASRVRTSRQRVPVDRISSNVKFVKCNKTLPPFQPTIGPDVAYYRPIAA